MTAIAYRLPDTAISRRALLAAGGVVVAGIALAEAGRVVDVARGVANLGVPAYLRRSSFVPLVGDRFELRTSTGRATARLGVIGNLVTSPGVGVQAEREDAFALVFHAAGRSRLDQDVMTLTHPRLGSFELLVAPSGTGHHGQDYTAIINRARPPGRSGGSDVRALPR